MTGVPIRRGKHGHRRTERRTSGEASDSEGDSRVQMEPETAAMLPQAKERPRLAEKEEARAHPPPGSICSRHTYVAVVWRLQGSGTWASLWCCSQHELVPREGRRGKKQSASCSLSSPSLRSDVTPLPPHGPILG